MSDVAPGASKRRLARPEASAQSRHLQASCEVAAIAALAVISPTVAAPWSTAIALLAAGAGAGYSLSGSV